MDIKLNRSDVFIIAIFFLIAIPVTYTGYPEDTKWYLPGVETLVYCFFTLFVTYITVYKIFPKYFPDQRILMLFAITVIFMMVCGLIEISCYRLLNGNDLSFLKKFGSIFFGISICAQNSGILMGILLGKKFYDAQLDIQKKDKEMKESELRLLKSQIDPHFLFNNLNTVDALIDSDPKIAKAYLSHLSNLYRYLIRTKDDEVVSLESELEFGKDYIYLLEKRYGNAFRFDIIKNNKNTSNLLIPPGALQTVLENVVKHNSANVESPLVTTITIESESITVINDKNIKTKGKSTRTGLNNLIARYQLLTDKKVVIQDDEKYSISLPIIKAVE